MVNPISGHSSTPSMAVRIREFDWSSTQLGAMENWSRGMLTALDLCLGSRLCSAIYWGPEHLVLYNDAYSALLGVKHPWALGRTAGEVWSEVFDVIGPLMRRTLETREATGADDAAIFLNRSGYVEEFYCSFSYSPLVNEFGDIEGVFTMFPETTTRVIGERRLSTLQELGAGMREIRHPREILEAAATVFSRNGRDVPFAGLYLWDEEHACAHLCACANVEGGSLVCPQQIDVDGDSDIECLVARAAATDYALLPITQCDTEVPRGAWDIAAEELMYLPVIPYGEGMPQAFILCGVNPYKRLDQAYGSFFRMLADQVSGSLAEAFGHEQEDARLRNMQERARTAQQEERVRIARDLHDTLLQSMQGLRFLLEAAIERSKAGDGSAQKLFQNALDASIHAIEEGRAVLSLLRATSNKAQHLASSLTVLGADLVAGSDIVFTLETDGDERELRPATSNDVYNICREAVANAVQHAGATSIAVQIEYGDCLRLCVRDDGCGIDVELAEQGRPGHFGLQGMRERSQKIGGALDISANANVGTRVLLNVPGSLAYSAKVESF